MKSKTAKPKYRNHNGKPPKNGRNDKLLVLERQQQVAELYLRRYTQHQIVEELAKRGVAASQPTVCQDIKAIFTRWEAECITDADKARLNEIMAVNKLEAFAHEELEFSRIRRIVIQPKKGDKDQTVRVIEERQEASIKWHERIEACIEMRSKLLGLVKNVTTNNATVNIVDAGFWAAMTEPPKGEDPIEAKIESVKMLGANKEQG